jgi:hypothetical protein
VTGVATRALFTGRFAAPFVMPPTPTVAGTPWTIVDDGFYNAWPVIGRAANGTLLLGYTKANNHHADDSGRAVLRISSTEGVTWGSEIVVCDLPSDWVSVFGLGVTPTGRVIASLWKDRTGVAGSGRAGLVYSDDHGLTWSAWVDVPTSFAVQSYATGPVVTAADGALLIPLEGTSSGNYSNHSMHMRRSYDNGLTWAGEVVIASRAATGRPYFESKLVRMPSGVIHCLHRCGDGIDDGPFAHFVSTSLDDGFSWGAPVQIVDGYAAPSVCVLWNGSLVFATRRNSDAKVIAFTSADALTWSAPIVVDTSMYEMEYAAPVQLLDGRVLLVYGAQPTSAITNSDIKASILS